MRMRTCMGLFFAVLFPFFMFFTCIIRSSAHQYSRCALDSTNIIFFIDTSLCEKKFKHFEAMFCSY